MQPIKLLRLLVLAAIFVVAYFLLQAWRSDYVIGASSAPAQSETAASLASNPATMAPPATGAPVTGAPASDGANPLVPEAFNPSSAASDTAATSTTAAAPGNLITVNTDLYLLQIDPAGGDIVSLKLKNYTTELDNNVPFTLFEDDSRVYKAVSGLNGTDGIDVTSRAPFSAMAQTFDMGESNELIVPLSYTDEAGRVFTKRFSFKRGEYPIDVSYQINNQSAAPWQGGFYAQLVRDASSDPGMQNNGFMGLATYLGAAWGTEADPYNKLKFKNFSEDPLNISTDNGWIAMLQHYFLSSWLVPKDTQAQLSSNQANGLYVMTMTLPQTTVAPGTIGSMGATLYAGPKLQDTLDQLNPTLDQTVDYGFLWPIAKVMFEILQKIHSVIGNWGWSIIVLTILIKLAFLWVSNKAYRSMAKMRLIAPKMQRMKEEFGEDRMRFSQEMMKLYKEEKVNPISGCLPLLIQMPFFLAFYWVLVESVELRHAPWILWIQDLSSMDPYFILPIFMGASMYVSQMLNPQPTDPTQAKVFKILPIIFTGFMLFFPAGLVLYWTVNNLFTLTQQYVINKQIEKEAAAREV